MDLPSIFLLPVSTARILYASVLMVAGSFFIPYLSLRKQKVKREESLFIGLLCVASGIWLYEIVYHYSYGPEPLSLFVSELGRIDFFGIFFNSSSCYNILPVLPASCDSVFPIIWSLIIISLPLLAYKRMRLNKYFLTALFGGVGIFVIWILVGFPQFFAPGWCSNWTGCTSLISYTPQERTIVAYLANSFSKMLMLAPALLFLPNNRRNKPVA